MLSDLFVKFSYGITLISIVLNLYIFTYPSLNAGNCSWVLPNKDEIVDSLPIYSQKLLAVPYVGDLYDQLIVHLSQRDKEKTEAGGSPKDVRLLLVGDPQIKGNWPSTPYISRFDTYGNDYYIGHIYNVMKQRLKPTHVSIMGDLFSSQWILDREYFNRSRRYIKRLFNRPHEHSADILDFINNNDLCEWTAFMDWFQQQHALGAFEFGYEDVYDWTDSGLIDEPLFINISGNHDIGNGDITYQHMARFFKIMGKDNYYIEYDLKTDHPWRIVVLNSLTIDGPFVEPLFLDYTSSFIDHLEKRDFNGSTILLTHVPFYKPEGLCVDEHLVEYFHEGNSKLEYMWGKIKSENHIQEESTQRILNAIFQNDKPGIILTGHDHEGCESVYDKIDGQWTASKESTPGEHHHIKEIVVRSIMGEFGGNAGIMTGHFNGSEWEYHYNVCPFIVQHVWWLTKVASVLTILTNTICFLFK